MVHIFIFFLWIVFDLSSKPKMNVGGKNSKTTTGMYNDNNQRLVRVFVDATRIHVTQAEPYFHWLGSCFSTHVQGNQFLAWKS